MKRLIRFLLPAALVLVSLCLMLVLISAIINRGLPQQSEVIERLSNSDKTRLAELFHLRQTLGDSVWPGWGQAQIPIILHNEEYAFLIGYPQPPAGWIKVPAGTQLGGPWETVAEDQFLGAPYYRQLLLNANSTPQSFTVLVGEQWTASLETTDWMKISLVQPIRDDLPYLLRPIFPYRLYIGQLVSGSDQYISLIGHETFHAYEGMVAPDKLMAAELANNKYESQYPWQDASLQADWQKELNLLSDALQTTSKDQAAQLAQRFLEQRKVRRENAGLSSNLIAYEMQREWEEGLARYTELEIWRQAATEDYTPIPETSSLVDFKQYKSFASRWSHEIQQITLMTGVEGDGRFYYTGMAQAFLLDRLMPNWKSKTFQDGIWLEDLLAEATAG